MAVSFSLLKDDNGFVYPFCPNREFAISAESLGLSDWANSGAGAKRNVGAD